MLTGFMGGAPSCGTCLKIDFSRFSPVVLHKAVAESGNIRQYGRGELLGCLDCRANPLMDRKVVGAVLFGVVAMVAVVTSLTAGVV